MEVNVYMLAIFHQHIIFLCRRRACKGDLGLQGSAITMCARRYSLTNKPGTLRSMVTKDWTLETPSLEVMMMKVQHLIQTVEIIHVVMEKFDVVM